MAITTFGFLCFLAAVLAVYYLVPLSARWMVLLAASLVFVGSYDCRGLVFILLTALSIFLAGRYLQHLQENSGSRGRKKTVLWLTLGLNLAILAGLKYVLPFWQNRGGIPGVSLLIPLGLSYYTLQAVSYVMDVYWGRIPAEKSFARLLLYVCYFPQMIQGPISRYKDLAAELSVRPHPFRVQNLKHGVQLMLWGYFKALAIGEMFMGQVSTIFAGGPRGLTVLVGLSFFGIGLYCNFSGGIDIVRGISACFGIPLPENFQQPYFSKSLSEFWRRWHMSLGSWMKEYAFYPLTLSRPMSRLKKRLKNRVSRRMANQIVIALANIPVFLLVGVWHGAGTNFALWGLYNGVILAFSELMEAPFARAKRALGIRDRAVWWQGFCMLRTFLVVALGRTTDCAGTAAGALELVKHMLQLQATNLELIPVTGFLAVTGSLSLALLLGVSIAHERGICLRERLDRKPFLLQAAVWLGLILLLACLGQNRTGGGFIYANY